MSDTLWSTIAEHIGHTMGSTFHSHHTQSLGGGCINTTMLLEGDGQRYFVKLNNATQLSMYQAEAEGLNEIAASHTIRVPQPICSGTSDKQAYLVLEYVEFGPHEDKGAELLGRQLAAMHGHQQKEFGWRRDNTIGATPQINTPDPDWITFWQRQRLEYQLKLATSNGYGSQLQRKMERLLDDVNLFFNTYTPVPSLLHGDLWSGNYAIDNLGQPVIYDPAVYYGDREADLAMTELFGGFAPRFYHAYRDAWPVDAGYSVRKHLYNLYHVLNHLNLFGGGYGAQAMDMVDRLLSEIR